MDLSSLKAIAFDLDGTLIDNRNLGVAEYVGRAPAEQKLYIVTFRTRREIATAKRELTDAGLDFDRFEDIIACPDRLVMEFSEDQKMRRAANLPMLGRSTQNLFPGENKYVNWKGYVARHFGCQVLVDDMEYLVLPGCEKYRVRFIDAARFPNA